MIVCDQTPKDLKMNSSLYRPHKSSAFLWFSISTVWCIIAMNLCVTGLLVFTTTNKYRKTLVNNAAFFQSWWCGTIVLALHFVAPCPLSLYQHQTLLGKGYFWTRLLSSVIFGPSFCLLFSTDLHQMRLLNEAVEEPAAEHQPVAGPVQLWPLLNGVVGHITLRRRTMVTKCV